MIKVNEKIVCESAADVLKTLEGETIQFSFQQPEPGAPVVHVRRAVENEAGTIIAWLRTSIFRDVAPSVWNEDEGLFEAGFHNPHLIPAHKAGAELPGRDGKLIKFSKASETAEVEFFPVDRKSSANARFEGWMKSPVVKKSTIAPETLAAL